MVSPLTSGFGGFSGFGGGFNVPPGFGTTWNAGFNGFLNQEINPGFPIPPTGGTGLIPFVNPATVPPLPFILPGPPLSFPQQQQQHQPSIYGPYSNFGGFGAGIPGMISPGFGGNSGFNSGFGGGGSIFNTQGWNFGMSGGGGFEPSNPAGFFGGGSVNVGSFGFNGTGIGGFGGGFGGGLPSFGGFNVPPGFGTTWNVGFNGFFNQEINPGFPIPPTGGTGLIPFVNPATVPPLPFILPGPPLGFRG